MLVMGLSLPEYSSVGAFLLCVICVHKAPSAQAKQTLFNNILSAGTTPCLGTSGALWSYHLRTLCLLLL